MRLVHMSPSHSGTLADNEVSEIMSTVKAVIDIDAEYFDFVHLYELFKERPAKQAGYSLCSIAVTQYSLDDPTFLTMECETAVGQVKLLVPRNHVLLIEESDRFSTEKPQPIGFKVEPIRKHEAGV
jgi:hypothetical protein